MFFKRIFLRFYLGYIKEMCFPKGTTIKFAYDIIIKGVIYKNAIRKISLKNDFCEVNIVIRNIEGVRGLGEWKWILGYDDDKSNEYWSSSQRVYLTAKFNKFRSGHPDMPKYKEWVNSMFNRLRSHLDSDQQLETAREKYHLYKEDIDNHFKTLELRRKNRSKTDTTADEKQEDNKQAAADDNQPTK